MLKVDFYTKEVCSLCEDAYALLKMIQSEMPFELVEHDIYQDDFLLEEYQLLIPAIQVNDVFLNCEQMNYDTLASTLESASKTS